MIFGLKVLELEQVFHGVGIGASIWGIGDWLDKCLGHKTQDGWLGGKSRSSG